MKNTLKIFLVLLSLAISQPVMSQMNPIKRGQKLNTEQTTKKKSSTPSSKPNKSKNKSNNTSTQSKPKKTSRNSNNSSSPSISEEATTDTSTINQPVTMTQSYREGVLKKLEENMVSVKGGLLTIGATSEQNGDADKDERPAHQVSLKDFYICKYEVTQELWMAVMETTIRHQRDKISKDAPLFGEGPDYPMYYVSWEDCQEFIIRLNQITGKAYRLPTEAEWEYAARGGNHSSGFKYSGGDDVGMVAWYYDNSGSSAHPRGSKASNDLGLFDMSGNVYEWCADNYGPYASVAQVNPTGPVRGSCRIYRGGGWNGSAKRCRVSYRGNNEPSYRNLCIGFRLAATSLSDSVISDKPQESQIVVQEMPEEAPKVIDEMIYRSVEQMPQFPGGEAALLTFLKTNIIYPPLAAERNIQGKVIVEFIVEKDGTVGDVSVVLPVEESLDKEAVRVIRLLPKFIPARHNDKPVRVWYTLPIGFKILDNTD